MIKHAKRHILGALALTCTLAGPACAVALADPPGSGGSGLSGPPTSTTGAPATPAPVAATPTATAPVVAANQPISSSGNGITLQTVETGVYAHGLSFRGTVPGRDAGATVTIERRLAGQSGWQQTAVATVKPGGSFSTVWRASHDGHFTFTAFITPRNAANAARRTNASNGPQFGSPAVSVTILGAYLATYYGPGFFGHRTACGQTLTPTTLGVASRTLKCGTKVTVYYDGNEITVPVIDRGPYGTRAAWDLTEATAQSLGITESEVVGATWR